MSYRLEIYSIDVVNERFVMLDEIITYKSLSFTRERNGAGEASFTLGAEDPKATRINMFRFRTQVAVRDTVTNNIRFVGFINNRSVQVAENNKTISIRVRGYFAHLLTRRTDKNESYSEQDAGSIAWQLINNAQIKTNGYLGIKQNTIVATVNRDRTYYRDSVMEAIVNLTNVINGFDFELVPKYTSAGRLDGMYFNVYQSLGTIRNDIPKLELNRTVQAFTADDEGEVFNHYDIESMGTGEDLISVEGNKAQSQIDYTRREAYEKYSDIVEVSNLEEKLREGLTTNASDRFQLTVTLKPDCEINPSVIALGDYLQMNLALAGLSYTGWGRVQSITTNIDPNGAVFTDLRLTYTL